MEELAVQYDASPTQIALNWMINARGETVFAIPGASKIHHAQENVKAMQFKLTANEIQTISEISSNVIR